MLQQYELVDTGVDSQEKRFFKKAWLAYIRVKTFAAFPGSADFAAACPVKMPFDLQYKVGPVFSDVRLFLLTN